MAGQEVRYKEGTVITHQTPTACGQSCETSTYYLRHIQSSTLNEEVILPGSGLYRVAVEN